MQRFSQLIAVTAVLAACGGPVATEPHDDSKPGRGVGALPLATPCTIVSGVVSVSLLANETATLGLDGSNRLVVNTVLCSTATSSSMSRINVSSADLVSPSDEAVIIDGSSGFFAQGIAGGGGIFISLGSGSSDSVQVIGGAGNDVFIAGRSTNDTWVTTNHDLFKDVSMTGVEAITLTGNAGDDVLSGSSRNPAWVASTAFSTGLASRVALTLQGGIDDDTLIGGEANDSLMGGSGNDTLVGSLGDDSENGEAGDDLFDEGGLINGSDVLVGGADQDTVTYAARMAPVAVSIGSGANDGAASEADDVRVDVEVAIGGPMNDSMSCHTATACTLWGRAGDDTLVGRAGNDVLNGEAGDDVLQPGAGDDGVTGGVGLDTVTYLDAAAAVTVTLGEPGVASTGNGATGENDSIEGVEQLVGSDFNDTLTGNSLDNRITGGRGVDALLGGDGNDVFFEGSSSNGGDAFTGGNGEDRVDYSSRTAALTVTMNGVAANDGELNENDNIGADVENLSGGAAGDSLTGNGLGNKLDGNGGADTMYGLAGDDELTGADGFDAMFGGDGNDVLDQGPDGAACDCGNGFDIAICDSSPANCEVR